mmetsp:Transcript_100267/g.279293  ORF Transcript_100267/g.279293 Transcript_100267/m.279293 type:complete len:360 (+) Transcript_100267:676-1755(+)
MPSSISSCASRASLTASLAAIKSLIAEEMKPSPLLPSMFSSSSWTTAFASASLSLVSAETFSSSFSREESSSTTLSRRCAKSLCGVCREGVMSISDVNDQLFAVDISRCAFCGPSSSRANRPAARHLPASSHHSLICSPEKTRLALFESARSRNLCNLLSVFARCLFSKFMLVTTLPMCSSKSSSSTFSLSWPLTFRTSSTTAATAESIIFAPKASMTTGFGSTTASTLLRSLSSSSTEDFAVVAPALILGSASPMQPTMAFMCIRYFTNSSLKPWCNSSPALCWARTCGSLESAFRASLSFAPASSQNPWMASHILPFATSSSMSRQLCAYVRVTPCKARTSLVSTIPGERKAPARIT